MLVAVGSYTYAAFKNADPGSPGFYGYFSGIVSPTG